MWHAFALFLCLLVSVRLTMADVYLHNMRGSNNRLDEANRDRNNGNRMFDSQNNNRGGYNVGSLYYYEGEEISFEWTEQHGCGNEWNDCHLIVQYMCSEFLRDGVTTRTIPDKPSNCQNFDCNNDVRYGMHETYDYYMNCKYRKRNRGLFTADRKLNGQTAKYTRQNNNGQRRAYECPEERDYYPYWHPTPWIDVAVITNKLENCAMYRSESENVKGRHFCNIPESWYFHMIGRGGNGRNGFIPNTAETCDALNNDNTAMTNFLKEEAQKKRKALEQRVQLEFDTCLEKYDACSSLRTVGENRTEVDERERCIKSFEVEGQNHNDLVTSVSGCGNVMVNSVSTPGIRHPHANCLTCLPPGGECSKENTIIPRTLTGNRNNLIKNGGCPDEYRVDATPSKDGKIYCITEKCFNEWHEPQDYTKNAIVTASPSSDVAPLTDEDENTEYISSMTSDRYVKVDMSSVAGENGLGSWKITLQNCDCDSFESIIGARVYITEKETAGIPSDARLCGEIKKYERVLNTSVSNPDCFPSVAGAEDRQKCVLPMVDKLMVFKNSENAVTCDAAMFNGKHIYISFPGPGRIALRGVKIQARVIYSPSAHVDEERSNFLEKGGKLFTYEKKDGIYYCKEREITSGDCRSELSKAKWDLSVPHRDTVGYDLSAPECVEADWSRHNHLGNVLGGFPTGFNFTFPKESRKKCAMRLRYNITTGDYNGLNPMDSGQVNSTLNRRSGGQPAKVDVGGTHSIESTNPTDEPWQNARDYRFRQNPQVQVFDTARRVTYCDASSDHPIPQMNLRAFLGDKVISSFITLTKESVRDSKLNNWKCAATGRQRGGGQNPFCDKDGIVIYDPTKCMKKDGTGVKNAQVKFCPYDAPYHAERSTEAADEKLGDANKYCTPCAPTGPGPYPFYKGELKWDDGKRSAIRGDLDTNKFTFNFADSKVWIPETKGYPTGASSPIWASCPTRNFTLGEPVFASGDFDVATQKEFAVEAIEDGDTDFKLRLAINTNQFGRTFQDRSHRWGGQARDEDLAKECDVIKEVTVRGKRGNIVQVYPGVEYDFTPNRLNVKEGECIHFHWSGSNTNPRNNAGQGLQGTDRSNIALLETFRGEGARGVQDYGGKGRNGMTWTTKDHEPGYEFFKTTSRGPTMADMSCPGPEYLAVDERSRGIYKRENRFLHPSYFTKCAKCDSSLMGLKFKCSDVNTTDGVKFRFAELQADSTTCTSTNYIKKDFKIKANPNEKCGEEYDEDITQRNKCFRKCEYMAKAGQKFAPAVPLKEDLSGSFYLCVHSECGGTYTPRPGFGQFDFVAPRVHDSGIGSPDKFKFGQWGNSHPEHFDNLTGAGGNKFMGMSYEQLVNLALLRPCQLGGEMSELDDAGTDFHMRPVKVQGQGTYNYMCTRNNNFSNRSQKGKITISKDASKTKNIGAEGGNIAMRVEGSFRGPATGTNSDVSVSVPPAAIQSSVPVSVSIMDNLKGDKGMGSTGDDKVLVVRNMPNTAANLNDVDLGPVSGRRREGHIPPLKLRVKLDSVTNTANYYVWGFPENVILDFGSGAKELFEKPEPTVTSFMFKVDGKTMQGSVAPTDGCDSFCNKTCSQPKADCPSGTCSSCVRTENLIISGSYKIKSRSEFRLFEQSQVTVEIKYLSPEGSKAHVHTLVGRITSVPGTGSEIDIKLDVSCAFSDDISIMRIDLTGSGDACMANPDLGGCKDRWSEVPNVKLQDCQAFFQVGGSTGVEPSGAYQAKKRSDLPIIVGVTVACVVLLLASVLSAVYFRNMSIKDPKRWEAVKSFPARKWNYLVRSCSSSI